LDLTSTLQQQEPPEWAKELMNGMIKVQQRLETLSPQSLNAPMPSRSQQSYAESAVSREQYRGETEYSENMDQYGQTPRTQTVNINTQPTGTIPESVYQNETAIIGVCFYAVEMNILMNCS
jgi:hypothetical protein